MLRNEKISSIYKLLHAIFTFFYKNNKTALFCKRFRLSIFDGFIRFGCPGQDWINFRKYLSVCVRRKFCGKCRSRIDIQNFNFMFQSTVTLISADQISLHFAQYIALLFRFIQDFLNAQIFASIAVDSTQFSKK